MKNPNTEQWCIKTIYTEKEPAVSDPVIYGLIRNIFFLLFYLFLPCQYSYLISFQIINIIPIILIQ